MAKTASSAILQLIRRVVVDPRMRIFPDRELLQRFLGEQNEAAFEAILRRHGPMVLDVCRGVLDNEADAEDAFQATFLVLARKAGSIRKTTSLASWLHGVAYRTALKARAQSTQRRKHETHVPERQVSDPDCLTWTEVRRVLHEELGHLSEGHREPLVRCYLQGKTQDEAAALLGLSKGTLKRRLERGRELLRARLVRRGLGPAALLLAAAWPAALASAQPHAALVSGTVKGVTLVAAGQGTAGAVISAKVIALAQEVLKTMVLTKLKHLAVVLVCSVAFVGAVGSAVTYHAVAAQQAAAKGDAAPRVVAEAIGGEADPQVRLGKGANIAELEKALREVDELARAIVAKRDELQRLEEKQHALVTHLFGLPDGKMAKESDLLQGPDKLKQLLQGELPKTNADRQQGLGKRVNVADANIAELEKALREVDKLARAIVAKRDELQRLEEKQHALVTHLFGLPDEKMAKESDLLQGPDSERSR